MSAIDVLKSEFQLKNFWLSFPHKQPFYTSQWKCPQWLFIIYRAIMAAYVFGALIYYFTRFADAQHNPMVYLTTWSYLMLNFHFTVDLLVVIWMTFRTKQKSSAGQQTQIDIGSLDINKRTTGSAKVSDISEKSANMNGSHPDYGISLSTVKPLAWYFNCSWFLTNVISVWALIVTIIYYVALFGGVYKASDVNVHMMNTVVMLIDTIVCATPVKLFHAIYPIIYGLAYVTCNAIYWSTDPKKNVLYAVIMDWNTPAYPVGVLFGMLIVVLPLLQAMYFGIYRLKLLIFKKIFKEEYPYQAVITSGHNISEE